MGIYISHSVAWYSVPRVPFLQLSSRHSVSCSWSHSHRGHMDCSVSMSNPNLYHYQLSRPRAYRLCNHRSVPHPNYAYVLVSACEIEYLRLYNKHDLSRASSNTNLEVRSAMENWPQRSLGKNTSLSVPDDKHRGKASDQCMRFIQFLVLYMLASRVTSEELITTAPPPLKI